MKRTAGWTAAITLAMGMTGLAQQPESKPLVTVCLTLSEGLAIDAPLKGAILSEVRRVWEPLGVLVDERVDDTPCDRPILVKSDREATREDGGGETAIAWVTFVAGRARQLVFVRMGRARMLIDAFSPARSGIRPPGLTYQLLAKLLGRSLAHELGHILLNSLGHERRGSCARAMAPTTCSATFRPTTRSTRRNAIAFLAPSLTSGAQMGTSS